MSKIDSINCESKKYWTIDEQKKYLWVNKTLDLQVMMFENDQEDDIYCIWVKMLHSDQYVSNFFVYSLENVQIHPLDYAINMVNDYREQMNPTN